MPFFQAHHDNVMVLVPVTWQALSRVVFLLIVPIQHFIIQDGIMVLFFDIFGIFFH